MDLRICLRHEKVQRLIGLTFAGFFIMLRRGMEAGRPTLIVSHYDVSNQPRLFVMRWGLGCGEDVIS